MTIYRYSDAGLIGVAPTTFPEDHGEKNHRKK